MTRDFIPCPPQTLSGAGPHIVTTDLAHDGIGYGTFVLSVSNVTLGTVTMTIYGVDPASGAPYVLLASPAVAAVTNTVLSIGPGLPATANASANAVLPRQFRVEVRTSVGANITCSVGASVS